MNVLFLSSWYPTAENPNFGIFVKEHAKAIHVAGNNIVVLAVVTQKSGSFYNSEIIEFVDENGVRTVQIILSSRYSDLLNYLVPLQFYLLRKTYTQKLANDFIPNIVHSNVIFSAGILGNKLSKQLGVHHVITEHWSRIQGLLKKPILSVLGLRAYTQADRILPVSLFLQTRMMSILPQIDKSKFTVVGNVVDSKTFFYQPKSFNPNELSFCAIATWANKKIPDKMPELFIEALSLIQQNVNKRIVLTMIGGGDKVSELMLLCENKGVNCKFTGYIDKPQIAEYLQKANFFLHSSTVETFGIVAAESLLCGTPVICSNVGALPELINNTNGVLCDNDINSWINAINKALNTTYIHSDISLDIENKFSPLSVGNDINNVYSSLKNI